MTERGIMKRFLFVFILALTLNLNAARTVQLDFASRYIWRGFDVFSPNKPAIQPSFTYDFGESEFSINVWGSFSLAERDRLKSLDEIDITLTYEAKITDELSFQFGIIHYGWYNVANFTFKDSTTHEIFISAVLLKVFLSPALTIFYDINLGNGFYILLQGAHSIKLSDTVMPNFSFSLGYNAGQWIEDSGFSDLNLGLSLPFTLNTLTIAPFLNYTVVFLDSVNENNEIWFGLSLAL